MRQLNTIFGCRNNLDTFKIKRDIKTKLLKSFYDQIGIIKIYFVIKSLNYWKHPQSKCISCHKAIVFITGRTHGFYDFVHIRPTLILWDLSSLYVMDHLWQLKRVWVTRKNLENICSQRIQYLSFYDLPMLTLIFHIFVLFLIYLLVYSSSAINILSFITRFPYFPDTKRFNF